MTPNKYFITIYYSYKMASTKKEDDLASSISKTMTVDKLKTELTKNKIVYSTIIYEYV